MSKGFVHSVKVPRLYKTVAKVVQNVQENGASLKQLIYQQKHTNVQGVYALAFNTVRHGNQLNQLIRKTQILFKEQRLDPWLTRVLITELIWGKQCLKSESKPIQTVLSYEKEFREEVKNIVEDVDSLKTQKVRKPRYVRVNTLMMTVDQAILGFQEEGWNLLPGSENYSSFLETVSNLEEWTFAQDFHISELLVFPHGTAFFNHPGYKTGEIILQDKASCFPAFLLNPPPGSSVLDMCSAPGMKSTHLASILQNQGKIFSVEMDARRYKTLCDFVQLTNSTCVETINKDALTIDSTQYPDVEYILVDPSCSGTGMVDRKEINGRNEKCAPGRLKSLQSFQVLLLRHALLNFPSAKKVVYSTCSIHPEENEHVIDEILSDIGEAYKLISSKELLEGNWINFSSLDYVCKDNCLYARPEVDFTNGFFVAIFERNFDVPLPEYKRKTKVKGDGNSNFKNFDKRQNSQKEKFKGKWEGNEEKELEDENGVEKTEEMSERKLTASQKKRMRRRKKFNQNSESLEKGNAVKENEEVQELKADDNSKQQKQKKKDKRKLPEDESTEFENYPQEVEDDSLTHKPRKKKKSKLQEPIEVKNLSPEGEKNTPEKPRKKKSKLIEEAPTQNENLPQDQLSTKSEKKKKKRKHKESADFIPLNVDVDGTEIEILPAKKKKKKRKVSEDF